MSEANTASARALIADTKEFARSTGGRYASNRENSDAYYNGVLTSSIARLYADLDAANARVEKQKARINLLNEIHDSALGVVGSAKNAAIGDALSDAVAALANALNGALVDAGEEPVEWPYPVAAERR